MHGHDHNSKHKSSGWRYRSEDNRGEDKNYDIRDDLGDCTKTEKRMTTEITKW